MGERVRPQAQVPFYSSPHFSVRSSHLLQYHFRGFLCRSGQGWQSNLDRGGNDLLSLQGASNLSQDPHQAKVTLHGLAGGFTTIDRVFPQRNLFFGGNMKAQVIFCKRWLFVLAAVVATSLAAPSDALAQRRNPFGLPD